MFKFSGTGVLLALSLAALCGGCQRKNQWQLVPVKGIVTQAEAPLVGVKVVFWTDFAAGTQGPATSGYTDANGHYELRTHAGDRGAAVGQYRVCITAPSGRRRNPSELLGAVEQSKLETASDDQPAPADGAKVPQEFSQFDKTPLRAEVKPGVEGSFDFDIPTIPRRRKMRKTP